MSDVMELLSGKWKIYIIGALLIRKKLHFMELIREVEGIRSKMLTKELAELIQHKIVKKTIDPNKPNNTIYSLTSHGKTLRPLLQLMIKWGMSHRREIIKGDE